MALTRQRLEARRDELRIQVESLRLQLVATQGAIADLDYLLQEDEGQGPGAVKGVAAVPASQES